MIRSEFAYDLSRDLITLIEDSGLEGGTVSVSRYHGGLGTQVTAVADLSGPKLTIEANGLILGEKTGLMPSLETMSLVASCLETAEDEYWATLDRIEVYSSLEQKVSEGFTTHEEFEAEFGRSISEISEMSQEECVEAMGWLSMLTWKHEPAQILPFQPRA